jgi:SRSO17 transposase
MLRWQIERDYQEMKQEIGLGRYEGRGWRGCPHPTMGWPAINANSQLIE